MTNWSKEGREKILDALEKGKLTRTQNFKKRIESHNQFCLICKSKISYKDRKNKYCSKSCAAKANNPKRRKILFCLNCKKELINKNQNKYCTQKCQNELKYQKSIQNWKNGLINGTDKSGVLNLFVRRYLIEQRGERCELCGWNERNLKTGKIPLTIHHLNSLQDNTEEDLQILCPNCHSLTPTYGGANRGNGRKNRYKRL